MSLTLMDARNRLLQVLSAFEATGMARAAVPVRDDTDVPAWIAGHVAWFAEYWIGRNPQRGLGTACPADGLRLASIEPQADGWFDPALALHASRWEPGLPPADALRAYMLDTLEGTLELLERTADDDDALYFFRVALFHEERRREQLVALAQSLGAALPLSLPEGAQPREPVLVPASTWVLGVSPGGFSFDIERWAHEVDVPSFDIDAQPVTWSQYVEFVADGGYDREELWHREGWEWLQRLQQQAGGEGRRGPRYVDQIGAGSGAVLRQVFGRPARMSGTQPVMHVSWWEADAYARWMGRRLPTEVEWEMAAHVASGRGFRWGEVLEWTAGSLRPWPGFAADAWTRQAECEAGPWFGIAKVQRGSAWCSPASWKDAKLRRFAAPHRDDAFVGFRTCSL